MRQFAGIIIAFIMLVVMLKAWPKVCKGKKAPLGLVLFLTGLIMAVIGGLTVQSMGTSFVNVFANKSSRMTLIVVLEIGILGNLLKTYGILNKIVEALSQLVPSKKVLIMTLPAIMGLLPVPGGAFLSAPFVDSLGNDLQLDGGRKSVINLYFRHCSMFLLPYNTTMLAVMAALPEINVYHLIGLNIPFVIIYLVGAYFCYVRTAPDVIVKQTEGKGKALKEVLLYLSPVYMALLLNILFGLTMDISLLICIVWTYCLIGKDKSQYFQNIKKGINLSNLFMLIGVYYMQNTVKSMDYVMSSVGELLTGQSVLGFALLIPVIAVALGLSTGVNLVPMGILFPFVAGMNLPVMAQTVYAMYVVIWSFFGYYYSPFHLCHLLTIKYMCCDANPVYKTHLKMMPIVLVAGVGLFLLYYTVLL